MELSWLAIIVGVLGVARLTRLVVFDDYPPMVWLRTRYIALLPDGSGWAKLVECAFCAAPYLAAGSMAWAYYTDLHWSWWVFHAWLAVSYAAAIVVAYDQPE